jgi:hypothetical protein
MDNGKCQMNKASATSQSAKKAAKRKGQTSAKRGALCLCPSPRPRRSRAGAGVRVRVPPGAPPQCPFPVSPGAPPWLHGEPRRGTWNQGGGRGARTNCAAQGGARGSPWSCICGSRRRGGGVGGGGAGRGNRTARCSKLKDLGAPGCGPRRTAPARLGYSLQSKVGMLAVSC